MIESRRMKHTTERGCADHVLDVRALVKSHMSKAESRNPVGIMALRVMVREYRSK